MEYQVLYSAAAKRDIKLLYDYISYNLANPTSASTIVNQILAKCDSLSLFPEATPVRYNRRNQTYRLLQVRHYIIVYTINQSKRAVTIFRILYARRNLDSILPTNDRRFNVTKRNNPVE